MNYVTNKSKILSLLRRSKRPLTASAIGDRIKAGSQNTVYATISLLRKEGYRIESSPRKSDGLNAYSLEG